jgi:hypothetical protein
MILSYLRLAVRLPLRVVLARAAALGAAFALRPFRRAAAGRRPTYAPPPPGAPAALLDRLPDLAAQRDWILPLAERYRTHRFDLLGSGWVRVADDAPLEGRINAANLARARAAWALVDEGYAPIDWQIDFKSGYRWRESDWFGDIRIAPKAGADIKVPWELARMQHLPVLAYAYALTRRETYAREIRNQILDFIARNPPGFGVNWRVAMEVAIRAANWIAAYELLRAAGFAFDPAFRDVLKASLLDHGRHVASNLERFPEGRANHYLADIAGLAFVAAWLPRGRETDDWLAFAARELSAEVLRQFNPDGSDFEGSVCYHRLAAETAAFALAVLAGRGAAADPAPVAARLARAGEFLRDLTKPSGRMAQIGDNDSGRFFKFHPALAPDERGEPEEDSLDGRATLAALGALLGRDDLARAAGTRLDAAIALGFARGARFASESSRDAAHRARVDGDPPAEGGPVREVAIAVPGGAVREGLRAIAYPDFGVWLFRSRRLFLAVRCGAAARDGRGAHAHNDQLAIELAIDGEDWIADPGSYTYTADARLRNAYRSVAAHAAPRWFDGREPGRLDLGLFWLGDEARARCRAFADDRFVGEHFGFGRRVAREVRVLDDAILVRDFGLPGPGSSQRLAGRDATRAFFKGTVPFSPGYGRRAPA